MPRTASLSAFQLNAIVNSTGLEAEDPFDQRDYTMPNDDELGLFEDDGQPDEAWDAAA